MKKWMCIIVSLICIFMATGCSQAVYQDSLRDYIKFIDKQGVGYSGYELDSPRHFLPTETFLLDYDYLEGEFYLYEESVFKIKKDVPATSLLILQYDKAIYDEAKQCMINNIPAYNDYTYEYGDYIFYENANFINIKQERLIPKWFTMACYNDEKQILCFIGFFDYPGIEEKYYDNLSENWIEFIDTYYGDIYDFDK